MSQLHDERRTGIGGTDASALIGVNPWRTPMDIWAEKTGRSAGIPDNEAMRAGRMLEPVILDWYAEDEGVEVCRNLPMLRQDSILIGHVDGLDQKRGRIVEAKTASSDRGWGEPRTDQVPIHYAAQVIWYCGLAGLDVADIAVLFNGRDFRIYTVQFDAEAFSAMRDAALRFWECNVLKDVQPAPKSAADALIAWPQSKSQAIEANETVLMAVRRLAEIKAEIKEREGECEELESVIKPFFADNDALTYNGETIATFKTQSSNRFDQKAFEASNPALYAQFKKSTTSRVLRLK
jgi:putative phage-type endonuclease